MSHLILFCSLLINELSVNSSHVSDKVENLV